MVYPLSLDLDFCEIFNWESFTAAGFKNDSKQSHHKNKTPNNQSQKQKHVHKTSDRNPQKTKSDFRPREWRVGLVSCGRSDHARPPSPSLDTLSTLCWLGTCLSQSSDSEFVVTVDERFSAEADATTALSFASPKENNQE
jgi:hypothetical protein